jgi:hypothetical protein
MSRKRRNTSSPELDASPPPKRHQSPAKQELEEDNEETPWVDELTGQTGAFPGLGYNDGKLFYGPARDGIEYLKMVRCVHSVLCSARAEMEVQS